MGDIALRGNKLTAGRPGFGLGSAVKAATKLGMKIVKGKKNPLRMDQAQRLKDDQRKYRSEESLEADRQRDPILRLEAMCVEGKVASKKEFAKIRKEVESGSDTIVEWCEAQSDPEPETATLHVFSENGKGIGGSEPAMNNISDKIVMVDAINHALAEELEQNDKMVIFGQDVAGDKGGVFTATKELTKAFGKDRVYNAPLAESSVIGTAIGMACAGWKPVVEIQ